jgi:predicted transcriptional regulator
MAPEHRPNEERHVIFSGSFRQQPGHRVAAAQQIRKDHLGQPFVCARVDQAADLLIFRAAWAFTDAFFAHLVKSLPAWSANH